MRAPRTGRCDLPDTPPELTDGLTHTRPAGEKRVPARGVLPANAASYCCSGRIDIPTRPDSIGELCKPVVLLQTLRGSPQHQNITTFAHPPPLPKVMRSDRKINKENVAV